MSTQAAWESVLAENREASFDDLIELLRIPSVSTDEASVGEVVKAAEWVAERLKRAGAENVELLPTGKHVAVYGDWLHAPGKPTVLIYGHFDVQPADPLELWTSPPFEPTVSEGCIFARGASDMKADLLMTVVAFEAVLKATGRLPINVKFLFEGQEEIGSRDLGPLVAANRIRLACDLVLTPDGGQWTLDQPAMCVGTKGLCALQIDIETAGLDLHSGVFGGAVPNANHALVELLSTMHDKEGGILVEGFYDQVRPLSDEERKAFAQVPFDTGDYENSNGLDALVGEPGYTTYERSWARPTLEINGLWGGYQGDGVKTVIPAKAHAKITCRLVANQEPDAILDSLERHIQKHRPAGARVTVTRSVGKARPYLMPQDHPGLLAVADVLAKDYGKAPFITRSGGTLPIMDMFLQELNAYTVVVGTSLPDERIHSPNEFFRVSNYDRGQRIYALLFEKLGQVSPSDLPVR